MTEQRSNVVGILQFRDITCCIQALEKLEKEIQVVIDRAPRDDEWEKWQGLGVDVRSALGALRLIGDRGPIRLPNTAYTIHWEESLEKALAAMGLTSKPEARENFTRPIHRVALSPVLPWAIKKPL